MTNAFYYVSGIFFLGLAWLKHFIFGYTTPKPLPLSEVDECIDYDTTIANRFLENLDKLGSDCTLDGQRILELGPGSDLGVGLILVAKGASAYVGFDRHDLARGVPQRFYERLAQRLSVDLAPLSDGRVTHIAREDFDLALSEISDIDIVVSNAAFEHFDDVDATVQALSRIVHPHAKAAIEVDLQTHSRWIRQADPNNIYRYPRWLYRIFRFPGQPNRMRPEDYEHSFRRHGWTDIRLFPANQLEDHLRGRTVHADFKLSRLGWLSFVLCATKAEDKG